MYVLRLVEEVYCIGEWKMYAVLVSKKYMSCDW